jgi:hypothetical protein
VLDGPSTTSLKSEMSDRPETGWPTETRGRIAHQFSFFGRVGFYLQLTLLVVPILLSVYVLLFRRPDQGGSRGIDLGNYLSFGSLLVMIFTTYWFFRYMQLGERIKDPQKCPSPSLLVTTLWIGLWAGCLGLVFSMLLLFGAAGRLLFVLLANPQSGMLVAPSLGTSPTYSISAFDAVSLTTLLIMLAAELVVLGITLWLLFKITWPLRAETEEATTATLA